MQIALKNVWAQRIEIRRQSFGLASIFSTLWRCRCKVLQYVVGNRRLARGGMQGVMPRPGKTGFKALKLSLRAE
jgi:hypothetical protein